MLPWSFSHRFIALCGSLVNCVCVGSFIMIHCRRRRKKFTQWLSKAHWAPSYNIRLEFCIIKWRDETRPAVHPFALGPWRWMWSNKSGYKKKNPNRLTEMNRQTKQRGGRLQWSDDGVFIVAHAYLPAISNIQPHHHTKVAGSHCDKRTSTYCLR